MRALCLLVAAIGLFGCRPPDLKVTEPAQHPAENALVLMQVAVAQPPGYPPPDANWRCFGEDGPHGRHGWWARGDEQGAVQAFSMKPGVCWLVQSWDQGISILEDHGSDPRISFSVKPGEVVYVGAIAYSFFYNPYDQDVPEWLPSGSATRFSVRVVDAFPAAQAYVRQNFPEYADSLVKRVAKRRRAACFEDFMILDYIQNLSFSSFEERCPEIYRPEWD